MRYLRNFYPLFSPADDAGTTPAPGSDPAATAPEPEKIIPVTGKNADKIIPLAENGLIKMTEYKIGFKSVKEVDAEGKPTGVITKRQEFNLNLPLPTFEGLIHALQDDKQRAYILDVFADQIYDAARSQVNDSPEMKSQDELDVSLLTLEHIANVPKAERRGGGIQKETWDSFLKNYVEIMPALLEKPVENVQNAGAIFVKRLQPVKTNKPVLTLLKGYLSLWFQHSAMAEELQDVFKFLDEKIDELLKKDDAELLVNL